jgi:hypothetical protein
MPRRTRKQMVGKLEGIERAWREQELRALERELRRRWWLQSLDLPPGSYLQISSTAKAKPLTFVRHLSRGTAVPFGVVE